VQEKYYLTKEIQMGIKQDALGILARAFKGTIGVLGERNGARISSYLTERLAPTLTIKTKNGSIFFYCPGEIPLFRAETLLTKEPETIEWIDSFQGDSVFWDIGANIGVYSLYAALKPKVRVLAFEPSAFNYHILNRNIEINKMDSRILSFCVAFNDTTRLDHLYMLDTNVGGALSSFAEPTNWQGEHFSAKYKQGMVGFSVDDFIERFSPSFPNHIKIDVDGIEDKIISGAEKAISDERLRSLLVELDVSREEYCRGVFQILENGGMKLVARKHAPNFDKGIFGSVYNHIFVRQ
jgi:FkbM family methyltransferase